MVSPFIFRIQPPRIFHSRGTVQSKTCVPDGTSETDIPGTVARIISSDCRKPSPVILRQMGNRRAAMSYILCPTFITLFSILHSLSDHGHCRIAGTKRQMAVNAEPILVDTVDIMVFTHIDTVAIMIDITAPHEIMIP